LNPSNLEAQSDLFEYYLDGAWFSGAAVSRAAATAEQIARITRRRALGRAKLAREAARSSPSAEEPTAAGH